jgi:hypothetical protein
VEDEIEQLAERHQERVARRMRPVPEGIEPLDPAREEDLVELPQGLRQREGAHHRHQREAGQCDSRPR